MSQEQHYTFGVSTRAAERLRSLAAVFAPSTEQLLGSLGKVEAGALDLGCGPGYTTELLQAQLSPAWTLGVDSSEHMLELARARCGPKLDFALHDVSRLPFPAPPAELVYARFLVTHLREPVQLLRAWSTLMPPAGRLVLEETAFMRSEHPAFQHYYAYLAQLQAHYGQNMLVGATLGTLCEAAGQHVLDAGVRVREIPAAQMAALHAANLPTWSQDPYARAAFDAAQLRQLGETLREIAAGAALAPAVSVGMGYVIATARPPALVQG